MSLFGIFGGRTSRKASRTSSPRLGAESLESRSMMAALVRSLAAGTPDLAPASDSGWSAADNSTSVTAPTFSGTVRGAATAVKLFDGQTLLGTAPVVNGTYSYAVDPAAALPAGRRIVSAQAVDAEGNFGPRSRPLTVAVITAGPASPTIGLDARSDSGAKGDRLTNVTSPLISGVAPAGSRVVVTVDGGSDIPVRVGTRGAWSFRPVVANGPHTITAQAENVAGLRSTLATYTVTIDSLKPTASLTYIEADMEVEVRFSKAVSGVGPGAFRVRGEVDGRRFDLPMNDRRVVASTGGFSVSQVDADGMVYRIRMNHHEMMGGTYSITTSPNSGIIDRAGNSLLNTSEVSATF